jgi:hypothetical protein
MTPPRVTQRKITYGPKVALGHIEQPFTGLARGKNKRHDFETWLT